MADHRDRTLGDLPEWSAARLALAATAGTSGDKSAGPTYPGKIDGFETNKSGAPLYFY